ncbi:hypothetical protein PENTCL1PPCAC_2494, partial [Pristionchus entomophagus]
LSFMLLLLVHTSTSQQLFPGIKAPSSAPRLARPSASSGSFHGQSNEYQPAFLSSSSSPHSAIPRAAPMSSFPGASPDKYYSTGFAPAPGAPSPVSSPQIVPAPPSEMPSTSAPHRVSHWNSATCGCLLLLLQHWPTIRRTRAG